MGDMFEEYRKLVHTAYHEAAHAVVACFAGGFDLVTIIPHEDISGHLEGFTPWHYPYSKQKWKGEIEVAAVCMASLGGEKLSPYHEIFKDEKYALLYDLSKAKEVIKRFPSTPSEDEIAEIFKQGARYAGKIINLNWLAVDMVAAALLEQKTLKCEQVKSIIRKARRQVMRLEAKEQAQAP